MTSAVFILNGPNLNRLGRRQPDVYGSITLTDIEARCRARAEALGLAVAFHQSNHEGELVELIHRADDAGAPVIINAGAYTHTSIAIHDALISVEAPVIEVHLSNIHAREDFRRHSYVSLAATGLICGLGAAGYELALEAVHRQLAVAAT